LILDYQPLLKASARQERGFQGTETEEKRKEERVKGKVQGSGFTVHDLQFTVHSSRFKGQGLPAYALWRVHG